MNNMMIQMEANYQIFNVTSKKRRLQDTAASFKSDNYDVLEKILAVSTVLKDWLIIFMSFPKKIKSKKHVEQGISKSYKYLSTNNKYMRSIGKCYVNM